MFEKKKNRYLCPYFVYCISQYHRTMQGAEKAGTSQAVWLTSTNMIIQKDSPYHRALMNGDLDAARENLDGGNYNINARVNMLEAGRYLEDEYTALMIASMKSHEAIARFLIDCKANIGLVSKVRYQYEL